jgi:hypothetical protein
MNLAGALELGMHDFLEAIEDPIFVAGERRPARGWTAVEILEHVVLFEERYLDWIMNGSDPAPGRNADRELRLFSRIRGRLEKLDSPDVFWPMGRFENLAAAVIGFQQVRKRTISEVQLLDDRIYEVGTEHPYFGSVNGGELVHLIDGHARRHADQLRELSEALTAANPSRRRG